MRDKKDLVNLKDRETVKEKEKEIVFRGGEIIDVEAYEKYPARVKTKRTYLGFLLGNEEYVVEMERIKEIIRLREITEIPGSLPHLLGIISLRGIIVPVIDARRKLGLDAREPDEHSRILILYNDDEYTGLLVDKITEIMEISEEMNEPPPDSLTLDEAELIRGVNRYGERLIIILNSEKIVNV